MRESTRNSTGWTIIIIGCFFLFHWMVIADMATVDNTHMMAFIFLIISLWIISLGLVIKKKKRDKQFFKILFISITLVSISSIIIFFVTNVKSLETWDEKRIAIDKVAAVSQTTVLIIMSLIMLFFISRKIWEKSKGGCSKCGKSALDEPIESCKSCGAKLCRSCLGKAIVAQDVLSSFQSVKCLSCGQDFR